MLNPHDLDRYPDAMVELFAKVETDILADMAKRISSLDDFIPAAEWQFRKLQDMGNLHDDILKRLSTMSGKSTAQLKKLIKEAGITALKADDAIYRKAGLDPVALAQSAALQSVLEAGLQKTLGLFRNLTSTTANTATKQFEDALDRAYMQMTTGAFSRQESIKMAIKSLTQNGVAVIKYPSGHTDYMDVAVRRAVLTGVNQTAMKLQDARANEMGCDLAETSAHSGARPSHAEWQGKVFSRSGKHPKFPDFVSTTGYGTGDGLGGWNCRHSFYPFFEGVSEPAYSKEELKEMDATKYEYNGHKLTEYEATQRQRQIERALRRWKREFKAMEAANLPTEEAASKITSWQRIQRDFIQQTGLKRQYDRESVVGFGKSEASKAKAIQKKKISSFAKQHIASVTASSQLQNNSSSDIMEIAKKFSNRNEADKLFRPWTEAVWPKLLTEEKLAAYRYTEGSGMFNRPLRGYDKSWDESAFKGLGNVPLNNEGGELYIHDLMAALDKAELNDDVWLFRGSDQQSLAGLLGIDKGKIVPSNIGALNRKFAGRDIQDTAFMSTGIAADSGFDDKIAYEILAPKGTNGIYAEPFSRYGNTNTVGTWDGTQKASSVGGEAEVILQAGTWYKILEIKEISGKITVVLEVKPK